ncbi:ABC transporter transmembrane domain-containing protein [Maridesulfovibrio salexigens]|uniref:ABC transporter transmembrane region n=1 Tax=Maridesulfovibrio salexigens (strain ATCC 14822 / DSM 2638 / NCIMB 8403 / VKM B-1763) TaxID=526222 RepID=C6BVG4_MARSD|nr:ABC transporter transmembrane domain-containing protein [Maridesulfovibrio salexigens]ACS80139.1 ABC transporter transmembrane region [Maridesulfovibrio salexigens DSM 2638]
MDLSYFKKQRGLFSDLRTLPAFMRSSFDLFLASICINILGLALPIVLMQVYDRIVLTRATSTLLWLVAGFMAALFLETILRLSRSTITNWMSARFEHSIASSCVERWMNCVLDDFEKDGAGVHLDRLRAVNTLRSFYAGQAFQLMLDLPFAFIFLAVAGFIGGWQVAAYLASVALIFLFVIAFIRSSYSKSRLRQKIQADRRYNFLVESLSGIHAVKALTLEESMLRRHERLEADAAMLDYDVIFIGNLPVNIGNLFFQINLFGVLFIGGTLAISGHITLGSLAGCTLLSGRFFQPFRALASFWVRHADIEIAKDQIKNIVDLREESNLDAPCLPEEIKGKIVLNKVSYSLENDGADVFKELNMLVQDGEMVCINADSGRKSTLLLNLIYGLINPDNGQVFIDGHDLSEFCHTDFQGRMEYLPQQGTLFNGTIFDNLTLFNPGNRQVAMDAASLLQLDSVLSDLPLGYETKVGNKLYEFLPTGVVQRICLARALTVRPRILLLDKVNEAMVCLFPFYSVC